MINLTLMYSSVNDIKCPSCAKQIDIMDIKRIVSGDLFDRFERLQLERALDTMGDIVYCPRDNTPAIKLADDTMATCAECDFTFCTFCYNASHGSRPCKFSRNEIENAAKEYDRAKGDNDHAKVNELKKRYGSDIENKFMELKSLKLIMETTVKCPKCGQPIEKSDGCNKMTCTKCKCYFCYICGEICDPNAPYTHYQNPKSPCYGQLFLGMNDAQEQQDLFDMFF